MKAIQIEKHGDPNVLKLIDIAIPELQSGMVLVKNKAIGVNYVDVQHRQGGYYPVTLPLIPGIEAAGIIEAVSKEVSLFKDGDRVAYGGYMGGNYAEYTLVPEEQLVPVPEALSFELAAAGLMSGMTAQFLSHDVYPIQQNDWVLIHAAAGAVGMALVQMAKRRGAKLIGTVSTTEKEEAVRKLGADYVIRYRETDFAEEVLKITAGEGLHVIYDAVSKTTFDKGIDILRTRGWMVVYGQTSGAAPLFDINRLSGLTGGGIGGSKFLTWAALSHYNKTHQDLLKRAALVYQMILDAQLQIEINRCFALEEAAEAHRLLENRSTIGKLLLLV